CCARRLLRACPGWTRLTTSFGFCCPFSALKEQAMSDPKRCERCGGALPETGLLRGRCPRCMVELGLECPSDMCHAVIGTELLHYRIESHLGSGGMGEVYEARDTRLERRVAIKILPEVFAQDAQRVARFEREAKVLASLNHPNIAALYGLEQKDGRHF